MGLNQEYLFPQQVLVEAGWLFFYSLMPCYHDIFKYRCVVDAI